MRGEASACRGGSIHTLESVSIHTLSMHMDEIGQTYVYIHVCIHININMYRYIYIDIYRYT